MDLHYYFNLHKNYPMFAIKKPLFRALKMNYIILFDPHINPIK